MADFEQQTGNTDATPYRLGEVGPETQYALNLFISQLNYVSLYFYVLN